MEITDSNSFGKTYPTSTNHALSFAAFICYKHFITEINLQKVKKIIAEELHESEYSVFEEFNEYAGNFNNSQSIGTDFLVDKFNQFGCFVASGEHSKNELYYFKVIRSLAEYYYFLLFSYDMFSKVKLSGLNNLRRRQKALKRAGISREEGRRT